MGFIAFAFIILVFFSSFNILIFFLIVSTASCEESTKVQYLHPLDSASIPKAPLPAKISIISIFLKQTGKCFECNKILNMDSLNLEEVGRVLKL